MTSMERCDVAPRRPGLLAWPPRCCLPVVPVLPAGQPVQSFSSLPALPAQPTYRFERLPSQQAQPGHTAGGPGRSGAVQRRVAARRRQPAFQRAGQRRGRAGRCHPGPTRGAAGSWGGGWGVGIRAITAYRLRRTFWPQWNAALVPPRGGDGAAGLPGNRVVFESHASSDGPWLDNRVGAAGDVRRRDAGLSRIRRRARAASTSSLPVGPDTGTSGQRSAIFARPLRR